MTLPDSSSSINQATPANLDLSAFASEDERVYLPLGSVIIREGQVGDEMYVLLEGELDVTVEGRQIDRLSPGMILGEMALVDDRPRSATATARTDVSIVPINRERFLDILRNSPQFAISIMNIMSVRTRRLIEEEVRRQRMEEELAVGRRIQLSLLPTSCPVIPGYELAAGYRAARQVGGDLYDFIIPPAFPDHVHIVVADVTGKGVPAALYMAVSRTLFHTHALENPSPSQALDRVNQFIRQDRTTPLFLSAFYAVLQKQSGCLTFASAGHNPPFWIHAATGQISELESRGIVLGAFDGYIAEERMAMLEPGDSVVFFTDGITEARNQAGDFLDEEGLTAILHAQKWEHAEDLLDAIITSVDKFSTGVPQIDDFTVVVLRRRP
ncbi:MAG: SpoIIE family protein phosphatase [Chloroflexota bacterium]|jgi:serine phosphatase RsbU (regulator of sigma subunit)